MTAGSAFHLTASSVVASGPGGVLHTVCVNTGSSGATLTLHDGTDSSGAVIAVISAAAPLCLTYDAGLVTGLYAAVSGTLDATLTLLEDLPF